MTALRSRVIVQETRAIAPFYDKFLSAKKNGNKSVAAFWGLLRYQIKTAELDAHLDRAFRQLHAHSIQATATTGVALRIDFTYDDAAVMDKCKQLGAQYALGKADTIKLLLIASDMLDAQQTFVETLICAPATQPHGAGIKSVTIPVRTVEAVSHDLQSSAACANSTSSSSGTSAALELPVQPSTERTRFCNATNAWEMFKPLRPNSAMTANQLSDINLFGGSFVAMTDQELIQRGLTNPAAVEMAISAAADFEAPVAVQTSSAPKQQETSKADQMKLAQSMFAAAAFMIKDSE